MNLQIQSDCTRSRFELETSSNYSQHPANHWGNSINKSLLLTNIIGMAWLRFILSYNNLVNRFLSRLYQLKKKRKGKKRNTNNI